MGNVFKRHISSPFPLNLCSYGKKKKISLWGHSNFRSHQYQGSPSGRRFVCENSVMFSYRASSYQRSEQEDELCGRIDALSRVNDSTLLQRSAAIADLLYMIRSSCFSPCIRQPVKLYALKKVES